jgi:DNA-binding LytR/AlgR family response regulator
MTPLPVALIDDDLTALALLRHFAGRLPELRIQAEFTDTTSARSFLTQHRVDLLLLDLHLPDGDGFGLLDALPYQPAVILTTSSIRDSLQAYEYGVVDYLVKPFSFDRFREAIGRVQRRRAAPPSPTVVLKDGRDLVRVAVDDIRYVSAEGAYSRIHLADKSLLVNHLLSDLLERLPPNGFVRVHRSYLVGLAHVSRVSLLAVDVAGQRIPVGVRYRDALKNRLNSPGNGGAFPGDSA